MTRSPITAGGEVNWNSPGQSSGLPGSMRTAPSWPKSAHGLPSSRSRAISRRSAVAVREYPPGAWPGRAGGAVSDRHPTAGEHVGRAVISLDLRVVAPQLAARAGSSATTALNGVQANSLSPTRISVTSNFERFSRSGARLLRSPV